MPLPGKDRKGDKIITFKMYKRKDGLFELIRTYDGKRKYFRGQSQKDVWRKSEECESWMKTAPSFSAVADEWADIHFEEIEEGSIRSYRPALARAKAWFKDTPITDITPTMCQAYINSLRYLAHKTVRNHKIVLGMVFQFAIVDKGIQMTDPSHRVKVSDKLKQTTREALSPEQRMEVLSTTADEFQLAYVIILTGLRLGEALALQWGDITDKISITKAVHFNGNKPIVGRLKTKDSARDIPYLPQLKDRLEPLRGRSEDFVFGGETPITQSMLARRWEHWCKDHGFIEEVTRTPTPQNRHTTVWKPTIDRHQLRHEFCTTCIEAGISEFVCAKLLGHSDTTMVHRVYAHFRDAQMQQAAEALSNLISTQINTQ